MNPPLRQGRKEFLDVCRSVPTYLKSEGFFDFVIKKKMGAEYILKFFQNQNFDGDIEIISKKSGYWIFHYFQS